MSDTWDEHAEGWDTNDAVKLYATKAYASLVDQIGIDSASWKSKRVLDFGCGTGLLAEKVAPHVGDLTAVDTSLQMISLLESKNICNVTAIHGDILDDNFRFEGNSLSDFDLIYASSVCSFLSEYESAVAALARLLKPEGHFVQWDWQPSDGDDFGLSNHQIKDALGQARLVSVQVEVAFRIEIDGQTMPVLMGSGTR